MLADELLQADEILIAEQRLGTAAVRFGLDGIGTSVPLEESDEETEADGEEIGDFAEGVLTALNGGEDTFPEIGGVGSHEAPPSLDGSL